MKHGLFSELKRRHVYRVAVAYVAVGWLLIEGAAQLVPYFQIPEWSERLIVFLVLAGFPIALILAWAFELTPEGVRRTEPADSPEARPPEHHDRVGRTLDFIIIGVLVVAVAVMAWQRWGPHPAAPATSAAVAQAPEPAPTKREMSAPRSPPAPTTAIASKSIAVMPFDNLSTDKANAYFADGMQDLILTKLAEIGELKVISRTSTAKYASQPDDLKTIAAQLGVAHVLEGSVQKAGNSVLINVQLIDARTDAHIWARAYTRTLDNVFGVEGEVAGKIADALKAKLSPEEAKRLATALSADAEANDLFLRAAYFTDRGLTNLDPHVLEQAIPLYRQALARVPDFALSHARLSVAESLLAWLRGGSADVGRLNEGARVEANRALKLAPDLAEAHLAVGYCDYYGKSDYNAALNAFSSALTLRPNDADALAARGYVLRRQGKFDEAANALQQAMAHDPRNSGVAANLAVTYMATGRYIEAEPVFRHALALDPSNDRAKFNYASSIAMRSGDVDRALVEVQGDSVLLRQARVVLLMFHRKYRAALDLLEKIPDTPDNFGSGMPPKEILIAHLYRLSGDMIQARTHYAKALPRLRAQLPAQSNRPLVTARLWTAIGGAELGLGNSSAGLAALEASLAAVEKSGDRLDSAFVVRLVAARYAEAGRADQAVTLLTRAFATPGIGSSYSPTLLWIDPAWDPIRKDPAFQALLKKYVADRPATLPHAGAPSAANRSSPS